MLQSAKIGIGIAALGMAVALVPAASASASVSGVDAVHSVSALGISSQCKAYKADGEAAEKADGSALVKAIESGNWADAQKALLSSFNNETSAEKTVLGTLSHSPSSVKGALAVVLKFDGTIKSIVEKSTSLTSFETSIGSAETAPKLKSAEKTLSAYFDKQCPGEVPTTTPTT